VSQSYYERNRDQVLARRKARRAADPERYKVSGREQMRRWRASNPRVSPHHGLSTVEIAAALARQGGACGICAGTESKKWHGDHDHASGRFRGVLCAKCNMGLGLFNDDPARVCAAVSYLDRSEKLQALL
jgi:hypothetical protein